jgi:hypothetical protein
VKRTIFVLLGVLIGFLFAEVLRRKKMKRLKTLEVQEAETTARYTEYAREWEAELATMPFERRMDYALFQASLNLDNGQPTWEDGGYDDEEAD